MRESTWVDRVRIGSGGRAEPFRLVAHWTSANVLYNCRRSFALAMSRSPRRLATLILLLAVPLRVYAAAAMVFCSPGTPTAGAESFTPAHHGVAASTEGDHVWAERPGPVHEESAADSQHPADAGSFHDHFSCGGCCSTGMIAASGFDWKPQVFAPPAISPFVATAVPSTVPQRLERPPRVVLA